MPNVYFIKQYFGNQDKQTMLMLFGISSFPSHDCQ